MKKTISSLFTSLLLISPAANAQELLLQLGIDAGGDELVEVQFDNGDKQEIDAGGLIHFAVGGVFPTAATAYPNLETQLSIGWKFDNSSAKNGDVDWDRYPIELLQFHRTENWRFGAGITYHLNPKLEGSGDASHIQADFDDALGYIVEIDYLTSSNSILGAKFTFIDYEINATSLSGNSVGVVLGMRY